MHPYRRSLKTAVSRAGVGVHSGAPGRVTLLPATAGTGRVFRQGKNSVSAIVETASAVPGAMTLDHGGLRVSTIEHLMAALAGLGVSDVIVEVSGSELPILDGSSAGWVDALDEAGLQELATGSSVVVLERRISFEADETSVVHMLPCDRLELWIKLDFGAELQGELEIALDESSFRSVLAGARTFALQRDVARLRAEGRGRGASEENTVVVRRGDTAARDEAIRHKMLDLVGDLALFGAPLRARIEVALGSHAAHLGALRVLRGRGDLWRVEPQV